MCGVWLVGQFLKRIDTKDYLAHQRAKRQAANADLAKVLWGGGLGGPVLMRDVCNPKTVHHFSLFLFKGRLGSHLRLKDEILTHLFGQSYSYI